MVRNKAGKVNNILEININFWGKERERIEEWEGDPLNGTSKRLRMLLSKKEGKKPRGRRETKTVEHQRAKRSVTPGCSPTLQRE